MFTLAKLGSFDCAVVDMGTDYYSKEPRLYKQYDCKLTKDNLCCSFKINVKNEDFFDFQCGPFNRVCTQCGPLNGTCTKR
jgi:hypothetical protein